MADKFDKEKRSDIMRKVHGADTTPELKVRKLLFGMGFRYRLRRRDLPGNPDITLPKYKTVIFIHGCFWHGCPVCRHAKIRPKNNADYWNKKLDGNMRRDAENVKALEAIGWRVIVVWECETKKKNIENLRDRLCKELVMPAMTNVW